LIRDRKAVAGGEDSRNRAARRLMCDACVVNISLVLRQGTYVAESCIGSVDHPGADQLVKIRTQWTAVLK
jgi:hypothetical protein